MSGDEILRLLGGREYLESAFKASRILVGSGSVDLMVKKGREYFGVTVFVNEDGSTLFMGITSVGTRIYAPNVWPKTVERHERLSPDQVRPVFHEAMRKLGFTVPSLSGLGAWSPNWRKPMFTVLQGSPSCPKATLDIAENLANRQKAINIAMYGPPNPRLANDAYWAKLASVWGTSPAEAKTMLCGNCGFFDIKPKTLECIRTGIGRDGVDPQDSVVAAELGYCRAFHFKCAGSRTCSAWVTGGPIR